METCGITVEYNPFHMGHLQQISLIRQVLGKKIGLVVLMSGPFCQRGVPAILDKGQRAILALKMGADLVLELPQAFAIASAERFAQGAVQTLVATGVVRQLAYGTESPQDHGRIKDLATFLSKEEEGLGSAIRRGIGQGRGFAASRQEAVSQLTKDPSMAGLLAESNTILAVEYEKALLRCGPLPSLALPLYEKDRHSAGLIRDRIWETLREEKEGAYWDLARDLAPLLPPPSTAALMDALLSRSGYLLEEMLAPALLLSPLLRDQEKLAGVWGMQGGLAGRIVKKLKDDPGPLLKEGLRPYDTFIQGLASRAHPASRIRRAILAASLGILAGDEALTREGPGYIRILAFNRQGRHLLSYMRKEARLPLVSKASDFRRLKDKRARAQARLDLQAQAIWNYHAGRKGQGEFQRPPIQVH